MAVKKAAAKKRTTTSAAGKKNAAKHLGIGIATLYRKLKKIKDCGHFNITA